MLSIYLNSGLLTIHVKSARDLKSVTGKPCNTYVKVTVIPDSLEGTFCRTTLVKNDNHPWFDQKFSFEFLSADLYKRLLISVWNRDTKKNRSEFMGCMSFNVSHVIRKDTSGWFRLLNGQVGRRRHFAVGGKRSRDEQSGSHQSTLVYESEMEEDLVVVDDSVVEDRSQMVRSSARDRSPRPQNRVQETRLAGKTPYTTTMRMKKGERGYGFSVTWTHPPRIERVEPGLVADLAGMRVGDYIVFVGHENVVKMEEEEVLQLIQAAGDHLTLEIYRKTNKLSTLTSDQLNKTELRPSPVPVIGYDPTRRNSYSRAWPTSVTSTTPTLKVAFNKSIGGGILV